MADIQVNPFLMIAGSLSFAVGLAWNDMIQSGIKSVYPVDQTLRAKAIYAIIITVVIVIIAYALHYINDKARELKTEHDEESAAKIRAKGYNENMCGSCKNIARTYGTIQ